MSEKQRLRVMSGVAIMLLVVAAIVWSRGGQNVKPPPSEPGYYTGPMRGKGQKDTYGTDDGKRVPPPPGASSPGQKNVESKDSV